MKGGIVVMIEDAVERRFVSVASLDNAIHIARRAVHEMEWRNELVLPKAARREAGAADGRSALSTQLP